MVKVFLAKLLSSSCQWVSLMISRQWSGNKPLPGPILTRSMSPETYIGYYMKSDYCLHNAQKNIVFARYIGFVYCYAVLHELPCKIWTLFHFFSVNVFKHISIFWLWCSTDLVPYIYVAIFDAKNITDITTTYKQNPYKQLRRYVSLRKYILYPFL